MRVADIAPSVDKRAKGWGAEQLLVTGTKGTGKSSLTRLCIDALPADEIVLVIDSKHDWDARHWWRGSGGNSLAWRFAPTTDMRLLPPGRWVYRTEYPDWQDAGFLKACLTALKVKRLRKRSCTIVLDELGDLSSGSSTPKPLGKLLRESRSMWVRLIVGCQRPADVTLLAVQEATKCAAFTLQNEDNRKRLAKWLDPRFIDNPTGWHDFHFVDTRTHQFTTIEQGR